MRLQYVCHNKLRMTCPLTDAVINETQWQCAPHQHDRLLQLGNNIELPAIADLLLQGPQNGVIHWSTSMYSLTFCVRIMSPERHQWKPWVQAAAVMLRTSPRRRPVTGQPATWHLRYTARNFENAPITRNQQHTHTPRKLGFALCCHSNANRAPIAYPPNRAQLGGSLYHAPKLHLGPCSSVGVRPRTDRQTHRHTDTQTRVATIHFASSTTHAKCNER